MNVLRMEIAMKGNNFKKRLVLAGFLVSGVLLQSCTKATNVTTTPLKVSDVNALAQLKDAVDFKNPPSLKGINLNDQMNEKVYQAKRNMSMYDEQEFQVMQGQIIDPWIKSWKEKNVTGFTALFKNGLSISELPAKYNQDQKTYIGHIEKYNWNNGKKLSQKDIIEKNLKSYLGQFSNIVHLDLATIGVRSNSKGMRNEDKTMKTAVLEIRYDIRGETITKNRRNDRGMILATVEKIGKNQWSLTDVNFSSSESLVGTKPTFRDATVSSGLDKVDTYVRYEAIRRGGYAISASDMNKDGNVDLYIGTMKEGHMLYGLGEKFKFAPKTGIKTDTLVKSAVVADYDNDGLKDLLFVRFDASYKDAKRNNDVHFYKNLGDRYERKQAITHVNDMNFAMPAAVADYNKDGLLDIYIGYPGAQDFTFFESMRSKKTGLAPEGMYFNKGDSKFVDVTKTSLPSRDVYDSCCSLFPHSAMAMDHDLDGNMDIVVIDDAGKLSPFYINKGDGSFIQAAEALGADMQDYGMSVAAGDLGNNGTMDLLYTSVNFHSMERINKSMKMNWHYGSTAERYTPYGSKGLRYYKAHKTKAGQLKYIDYTEVAGLEFAGEGMAGVEFIDYNNDGHLDIYVANGLWSGTSDKKSQDISSLFTRTDRVQDSLLNNLKALGEKHVGLKGEIRSQSIIMEILSKFKGDADTTIKNANGVSPSLAGYQRNRLFRNLGDDTFVEVGYLEGVDSIADGYIVALSDLNKDGKVDMILRNADPGTLEVKQQFNPIELFMNESNEKNNAVILSLEGTKSNTDAIGAIATAKVKGQVYTRNLLANNGTAQSERFMHFGIGKASQLDEVKIHWPSGQVSILKNIPVGRHHIVEGKSNVLTAKR
jgi:hypothetical protein